MTTDELVAYYVSLLIRQFFNKPKAQGTIDAVVRPIIADQIVQEVEDGFDLETAVGVQLAAVGSYRGARRSYFGLDLGKKYFAMPFSIDTDKATVPGFATVADNLNISWYFLRAGEDIASTYTLNDGELRGLIQYLADLNSLDLTFQNIDALLFKYFGNYVTLQETGPMAITYTHDPTDPSTLFLIVKEAGVLPSPAGVNINVL